MEGDGEHPANALLRASSPYLRAHAHDPVRWRAWSDETFAEAKESDRPIFLSVGYQSCHWCHVMQRESFKDEQVAEILNSDFIPVKVDREVRPDVDALYMAYVQAVTGSGGWPMSVFLTPDLEPFFGGTYFPPVSPAPRIPSFKDVLELARHRWQHARAHTREVARDAMEYLAMHFTPKGPAPWDRKFIEDARTRVMAMRDEEHGGFGTAPKFPMATTVEFLLALHDAWADEEALRTALRAVLAQLHGGIWDQVEGGLFRYSTDDEWLVPHFEKMLYDQALMLTLCARLYEETQADEFAEAAEALVRFLEARLASPDGVFYSSLDADTEGVEGATYVWRYEDLADALTQEELALAREWLGVSERGNWEGRLNILTRRAGAHGPRAELDGVLAKLARRRDSRPQPDVVENVIVSWNALLAKELVEAGKAIGSDSLVRRGVSLVDTLLASARQDGKVLHILDAGTSDGVALLEDAAFLAAASLSAGEATGRDDLIDEADRIHTRACGEFASTGGARSPDGFVMSTASELPLLPLEQSDSPTPSGASTLAENEWRLALALEREPSEALIEAVQYQLGAAARVAPHLCGASLAVAVRRMSGAG